MSSSSVTNNVVSNSDVVNAVPVRELMGFKPEELLKGLRKNLDVLFEDNVVIKMRWAEVVLNRYVFILLDYAPNIPILSKYCIKNYYNNGIYTSKTINKVLEKIFESIVKNICVPMGNRDLIPVLAKTIYQLHNRIYNEVVYELLEYAGSVDIVDFLEIQKDPRLLKAIQKVDENKDARSINEAYDVLETVIKETPDNIISKGYIGTTFNPNQVKQLLGPRGHITEINSDIFKFPVASSFVLGMNSMTDIAMESRAAAKALHLSSTAVQQSEYIAREMQMVSMYIQGLWYGDCGTKTYTDWYVRGDEPGVKSDIPSLTGKWFLNDAGVEECITSDHKYLEGKTIKLRMIHNCRLPDKRCVCSRCYGELSWSIPKHANIGHYSSTYITQKLTQAILSTKHHTSSAVSSTIVLDDLSKQYMVVKQGASYAFRPNLLGKVKTKYYMIVTQAEAPGIKDFDYRTNVNKLRPNRVSRIRKIILMEESEQATKFIDLPIKDGNRIGSFTYKFLEHIRDVGYSLDKKNRFVISLEGWGNKTFIDLPNLEFNHLEMIKMIRTELKYMKTEKAGFKAETIESFVVKLNDMLNSKLDVPLIHTEIVVAAHTVANPENRNYDMARNNAESGLANYRNILSGRSLGAGYAWERVMGMMLKTPLGYGNQRTTSHPMDVFIRPNEAISEYERRGKYLARS